MPATILLAGAAGDLGARIARALVARGATVRALIRPNTPESDRARLTARLTALGAEPVMVDPTDRDALTHACEGVACVVSALNGLSGTIIDRQGLLLDAAVQAGVPRFIPSDFALDFTKTRPGRNRNLDLRRAFAIRAERAPIKLTSILNGAFLDMLGAEMPLIQPAIRRVLYWGDSNTKLDFTAKDDVAAFTAAAALDDKTPRLLRIAGDTLSARELAAVMEHVTGRPWRTQGLGGPRTLDTLIRIAKAVAPQPAAVFPPWQGMQYVRDMFSGEGQLRPLDNDRYPGIAWTKVVTQARRLPA